MKKRKVGFDLFLLFFSPLFSLCIAIKICSGPRNRGIIHVGTPPFQKPHRDLLKENSKKHFIPSLSNLSCFPHMHLSLQSCLLLSEGISQVLCKNLQFHPSDTTINCFRFFFHSFLSHINTIFSPSLITRDFPVTFAQQALELVFICHSKKE